MKIFNLSVQRAFLISGILMVFSGCVAMDVDSVQDDRGAALIVARTGDEAILTWRSRIGESYTILYADGRHAGADWRALPEATNVPGTGQEIRIRDRIPPGMDRQYRMIVIPRQ